MKTRSEYIIYLGLVLSLAFSLIAVGRFSDKRINEDLAYHGKALSSYAWELDYRGVEQYLTLAVDSNSYGGARFFDFSTNLIQSDVKGKNPGRLDSLLIDLGILRATEKEIELYHENELIGILKIDSYNRYIYLQFYVCLVYILFFFIAYLIMNLARARAFLEERVRLRTADLQKEIDNRLKTEKNLRLTLDSIGDGVISTDRNGRITALNPVAQQLTGFSFPEARGRELIEILDVRNEGNEKGNPFRDILELGKLDLEKGRYRILVSRQGEQYRIAESGAPILSEKGDLIGTVLVFRDMTGEYVLQKQLEHSQRMDAVGQLAGGIAHDFNNMLGGIMGSSELLDSYIEDNEKAREMNQLIHETTERAADLTRQLLTFSRKNTMKNTRMDLHDVMSATAALLERTIDRRIGIKLNPEADQSVINGDASMIQNALINLGINASHAISGEGHLDISTRNTVLDREYCRMSPFGIEPGPYVELIVEDDGLGMPEHVRSHIFEPFFTTKSQGEGTGLGLATVYGTVNQHRGEIRVYSEEGKGTAFYLAFPLIEGAVQDIGEKNQAVPAGSETILVVDDIDIMRITVRGYLEEAGYTVITAEDGYEAVELFSRDPNKFDLVIVDMIMPRMSGKECFLELRKISSRIPVILSSGYVSAEDYRTMKLQGLNGSISKPFRGEELTRLVYDVLHKAERENFS